MSQPQVIELQQNVNRLVDAYRALLIENQRLNDELHRLNDDNLHLRQNEKQLRNDKAALQIAAALSPDDEERKKAKQRIDQMITDIDKCLALLSMM